MFRSVLALVILSCFAADASACGGGAGLFRGRVRDRLANRPHLVQRVVTRVTVRGSGGCASAASGVVVTQAAPVVRVVPVPMPCLNGKCPVPAKK